MDNQLAILLTAKNMVGPVFNQVDKQVSGYSKSILRSVMSIQTGIAALGIGLVVKEAVGDFKQYETALNDMAKVTDQNLKVIDDRIMAMPPALGTATEMMQGYYNTISAGITDSVASMDFLTTASKASNAAHVAQGEVVKALSKLMAGYDGQIRSATEASDLLFAIEKEGQTTFEELVPVIGDLATNSKQLNVEQSELGASMALLTQTSGSTSMAATKYNAVLMGLFKPTKQMVEVIAEMGYESGAAMVKENGLAETLKMLTEHTKSANIPLAKLFENKEALTGIAALAANNFQNLTDKIEVMKGAAGGTESAFANWRGTFEATEKAFTSAMNRISIELGKELSIPIQDAMEGFTEYVLAHKEDIIAGIKGIGLAFGMVAELAGKVLVIIGKLAKTNWATEAPANALKNVNIAINNAEAQVEAIKARGGNASMVEANLLRLRQQQGQYAAMLNPKANTGGDKVVDTGYKTGGGFGGETVVKVSAPAPAPTGGARGGVPIERPEEMAARQKKAYEDMLVAARDYDDAMIDGHHDTQDALAIQALDRMAREKEAYADTVAQVQAYDDAMIDGHHDTQNALAVQVIERAEKTKAVESALYQQMGAQAQGWYEHELGILNARRQEYERLGVDKNQIDQWYTQEFEALQAEQVRAHGSMVDGFILGMQEMADCQRTWAEEGISLVRSLADEMQNGLAGVFKALVTDINDVDDALKAAGQSIVDNLINTGSQIAADKVMGGIMEIGGTALGGVVEWGKNALGLAEGAWTVNEDGLAMLHRGEKVVPAHAAKLLDESDVINWDARPAQKAPVSVGMDNALASRHNNWMSGPMSKPAFSFGKGALATALTGGSMTDFMANVTAGLPGMVAGIIRDEVYNSVVKYQTDWGKYGGQIMGAAGSMVLGPAGGALLGLVGALMGEGIADLMDARVHEDVIDMLEKSKGWGNVSRGDVYNQLMGPGGYYGNTYVTGDYEEGYHDGLTDEMMAAMGYDPNTVTGYAGQYDWNGDYMMGAQPPQDWSMFGNRGGGTYNGPGGRYSSSNEGDYAGIADRDQGLDGSDPSAGMSGAKGGYVDVGSGPNIGGFKHGLAYIGDKEYILTPESTKNARDIVLGLRSASVGVANILEAVARLNGPDRSLANLETQRQPIPDSLKPLVIVRVEDGAVNPNKIKIEAYNAVAQVESDPGLSFTSGINPFG